MNRLKTTLCGIELMNPIITASGSFGFGREYNNFSSLDNIGAISVKGLTLKPRIGNDSPRIAETPMGILNSVGLQNPGVEAFINEELPFLKQFKTKVIANIAGNTISEYCKMAEIISCSDTDFIEMNISCPNVKEGGVAFGVNPKSVEEIVREVKKHSRKPLIVKLSPNVSDIALIAKVAEQAGADALSLINTLLGMKIDVNTKKPVLRNNYGGLSGPAVMPVAVRMVNQVANSVTIPVIGMGGISSGRDALEFMMAGADAVAVGTAFFGNPLVAEEIKNYMGKYSEQNNLENISEIVGCVKLYN